MYIFKVVVFCHGQVCMGLMTMATPNTPTALLAARGTMMNHEIWGHLPVRIRIGMTPRIQILPGHRARPESPEKDPSDE